MIKSTCKFDVRDTGIGIPSDKVKRLFQAFTQIDSSTTRKYGGTGLGLVICEKLVQLMGGTISVASEEGVGTCFSFTLHTHAVDMQSRQTALQENIDLNGKQILIVDDNPTNLIILKSQLERLKANCIPALSGSEALDILSSRPSVQLVLADMQMPVMDGVQLADQISQKYPELPYHTINII